MKIIKKLLVAILTISMSLGGISVFANTNNNLRLEFSEENLKMELEKEMLLASRELAEKQGKLMDELTYDNYIKSLNQASITGNHQEVYKEYEKYFVSESDVYNEYPELRAKASRMGILDETYKAGIQERAKFGDVRVNTKYTHKKNVKLDEKKASTWDRLTQTSINIISLGLKPAASIVLTVLQSVIPDDKLVSYADYSVVSIYNSSSAVKWGEVYTPGGTLGVTGWTGYACAVRNDNFAYVTSTAWKGNRPYTNTSKEVQTYYGYNNRYYEDTYLKNKAKELYKKSYDETYTPLYGVIPKYVEYNLNIQKEWKNTKNNPFS